MKATFFVLTCCLVFLATSAWAEEERLVISERKYPNMRPLEQICIEDIAKNSRPVQNGINHCLTIGNVGNSAKQSSCIKSIPGLKACFKTA
jgi:hypothetical protein